MKIQIIKCLQDNYSYLIIDETNQSACVVDPSEAKPIIDFVEKNNINLKYILNTHHHFDHVGGNLELKKIFNCKIIGSFKDLNRIPGIELGLKDQELFDLGGSKLRVIETPGHTVGHICFYSYESKSLFSGDTLFSLGCGRLFEGSADQMVKSLKKLRSLPKQTKIYCGHEYTKSNANFAIHLNPNDDKLKRKIKDLENELKQFSSTIPFKLEEEIEFNPFLKFDNLGYLDAIGLQDLGEFENFKRIRKMKDEF